jgi:tRNA (cytidine/uridine-2'-O-)-methyltransferase
VNLKPHKIQLALVQPQIAPNAGNVGRLCVATGTKLHFVRPMGFVLSDRELKRSAMDYWDRLQLTVHDDLDAFLKAMEGTRLWFFTSKGKKSHWDADFSDGDCLVFGSETAGLPKGLLEIDPERNLRIPQVDGERCLNLSTSAGIGLYEALKKVRPTPSSAERA